MSDLFDDFNKIFKKDFVPIFLKYIKDPNNKITDNLNNFLNNPQTFLTEILEKFSRNKDIYKNQRNTSDNQYKTDIYPSVDNEYDDLLKKLIVIEENMIQIQKILKDKN